MNPAGIDIQVIYSVIEPGGAVYRTSNTRQGAEAAARFKAGATDYARCGYVIRPRILPTVIVERTRPDTPAYMGDSMRFVGGSF